MWTGPLAELLAALQFCHATLPRWDDRKWAEVLPLSDRAQLTLPIGERWLEQLPTATRQRIARDLKYTALRQHRVRDAYVAIANSLNARGLTFVVLKGFSGNGDFFADGYQRAQYDLDLLLPQEALATAQEALIELGYHSLGSPGELPTDHLPVMVPKTGWEWRGDFFDPEIPVSVDLHFRLWDEATERFAAPGWEQFFDRRVMKSWDGLEFPALAPIDALAYHCLHLLRHLLRGSLRLGHVHELAYFLHSRESDHHFWVNWEEQGEEPTRNLQALCFALARRWFRCELSAAAQDAVNALPDSVEYWLKRYGHSPVEGLLHPNKHELWLHLSLVERWRDRRTILRRRLLPISIPRFADTAYLIDAKVTWRRRWLSRVRRAGHILERAQHHTRTLPGVIWHGSEWAWANSDTGQLSPAYWSFLCSATFFNLGSFLFLILYNLYLVDLGFREDALGRISAAMTAGSLVGSVPGGMLLRRFGVRATLTTCFAALAAFSVGRILFPSTAPLLAFAFGSGCAFSLFAVTVAPAIAQLSSERLRPRAFSVFFSVGIALGIAGGQLAGHLPGRVGSKRTALLVACTLIALAILPAVLLNKEPVPALAKRPYPSGPFIRRFLAAIAVWSMAAGAFNPFFNVFFAQSMHGSLAQIGNIYSLGQAAQVVAILVAPHLLSRLGLNAGVALSQFLCGLALVSLALAAHAGIWVAGLAYAAYLGFHFMGEPGLFSLLMNHAAPEERSGASALNFLATFAGQAIAVAIAGVVVVRYGYLPIFSGAALLSGLAALIVWRLLGSNAEE